MLTAQMKMLVFGMIAKIRVGDFPAIQRVQLDISIL
jgi:hypothetical protein